MSEENLSRLTADRGETAVRADAVRGCSRRRRRPRNPRFLVWPSDVSSRIPPRSLLIVRGARRDQLRAARHAPPGGKVERASARDDDRLPGARVVSRTAADAPVVESRSAPSGRRRRGAARRFHRRPATVRDRSPRRRTISRGVRRIDNEDAAASSGERQAVQAPAGPAPITATSWFFT